MAEKRKTTGKGGRKKSAVFSLFFWLLWSADLLLSVWCIGAIWYQRWIENPVGKWILLALFGAATLILLIGSWKKRYWLFISLAVSVGVMTAWLLLLRPTGKYDWDPPLAKMPKAHFSDDGNSVTIEFVRDFHYRTEDDYDVRYRTESYNFADLEAMDYSITHWNGAEFFGHIMLSFRFKDGRRLVLSPEARMERGKRYELFPGFFRRYELIFIVATEEDAFQLRTHHRKYEREEVLLYPTNTQKEVAVFLLKDLLKRGNELEAHPEFYNGIIYNCLSTMAPTAQKLSFDFCDAWRGVFNGLSDRTGFYTGWFKRAKVDENFADFRKRHSVNQYVEDLTDPPDYSRLIRPWER